MFHSLLCNASLPYSGSAVVAEVPKEFRDAGLGAADGFGVVAGIRGGEARVCSEGGGIEFVMEGRVRGMTLGST